jgi:hypothetical protein
MVILARRYWPKECERCNWWCGTNDNATQAGPSTRGDGHRRSGAARDEEATEIQFKPKSRCDVRPGILPGKMRSNPLHSGVLFPRTPSVLPSSLRTLLTFAVLSDSGRYPTPDPVQRSVVAPVNCYREDTRRL